MKHLLIILVVTGAATALVLNNRSSQIEVTTTFNSRGERDKEHDPASSGKKIWHFGPEELLGYGIPDHRLWLTQIRDLIEDKTYRHHNLAHANANIESMSTAFNHWLSKGSAPEAVVFYFKTLTEAPAERFAPFINKPIPDLIRLWNADISRMKKLASLAEKHDIKLIWVALPIDLAVEDSRFQDVVRTYNLDPSAYERDRPTRMLTSTCERNKYRVINTEPYFQKARKQHGTMFQDDQESAWTEVGHALVGELITKVLDGLPAEDL